MVALSREGCLEFAYNLGRLDEERSGEGLVYERPEDVYWAHVGESWVFGVEECPDHEEMLKAYLRGRRDAKRNPFLCV